MGRFKSLLSPKESRKASILGDTARLTSPPSAISGHDLYSTAENTRDGAVQAARAAGQRVSTAFSSLRQSFGRIESGLRDRPRSPARDELDTTDLQPLQSKGHAHNTHNEHLFLSIGPGPDLNALLEERDDTVEEPQDHVVCESPPPAGFDVFHKAYHKELERIHVEKGTSTTTYLTRRVASSVSGSSDEAGPSVGQVPKPMSLLAAAKMVNRKENADAAK